MSFNTWLQNLKSTSGLASGRRPLTRPQCRKPAASYRLTLESLEDRLVPSTFTVLNTLDSGAGSFRAALTQVNADTHPGIDTINFAIGSGVKTIVPLSDLPTITHSVVIDGTSQPGFAGTPLIELDGAGSVYSGLTISANSCTVKDLAINRFSIGILLETIKPGAVIQYETIEGNYIGTDVTGEVAKGNGLGVDISAGSGAGPIEDVTIGGTTAAARNIISGNGVGVEFASGSIFSQVEGNYIGTDVTGTHALGNTKVGMSMSGDSYCTIGGTTSGARNLISGNGTGIYMGGGYQTVVEGNFIGTDVTGTQALGNDGGSLVASRLLSKSAIGCGIFVESAAIIGGTAAGAGNTIAFNASDGVFVGGSAGNTGVAILGNSIFSNGRLGIELGAPYTGNPIGNRNAQAPVFTSAVNSNGNLGIGGTLTSTANTTFTLQFFSNPSGTSQGQTYLGSITVTTDATGKATFTATFAVALAPGQLITATATDPFNDTSMFSNGEVVT